jgi:hypothetical protein
VIRSGDLLVALGVLKVAVGAFVYRSQIAEIAREGFIAAVPDLDVRAAALWFLFAGGLFVVMGIAVGDAERAGQPPSRRFGVALAVVALLAAALMPASGVWLVFPIAALVIRRQRPRS